MEKNQTYDTLSPWGIFKESFYKTFLVPFTIPTAIRTFRDIRRDYLKFSTGQELGLIGGATLGGALDIIEIAGCYNMGVNENFPELVITALGIPNLIFGIYEINRAIKNKKEKRKSLEASALSR